MVLYVLYILYYIHSVWYKMKLCFSVGAIMIQKKGSLYTNFKRKNTFLPTFRPDALVIFRAQVKFAQETTLLIA